jgi:signal transduction histidine kinase
MNDADLMESADPSRAFAAAIGSRLRDDRIELVERWLERITERVALAPNRVFPSQALLDHVPILLVGIADYVADPARPITADSKVVAKAMELGELRHDQGFTEYEILKEFEIFGGVLFNHLSRLSGEMHGNGTDWAACAHRMFQALAVIQEASTTQYLQLMSARIQEREDRLRAFDRALTHELRNRIGAVLGASQLLESLDLPADDRRRLASVVARNAGGMHVILENLLELSRLDSGARQQRHVLLAGAATEAVRHLREMAGADRVIVSIDESLPAVEVNAPVVELAIANFVSNGIRYADPSSSDRWVRVSGEVADDGSVVVRVRDNGIGVPPAARPQLFGRFFRVDAPGHASIDGTGLGLSIVRDAVNAIGGRVWAEFPEEGGSEFSFSLPARRSTDIAGA